MTETVDRKRVQASFHRQAGEYDHHAQVQKRVVTSMLRQVAEVATPQRLLDVGAGTGELLSGLAGLYPAAHLVGLDLAFGMCHEARGKLMGHDHAHLLTADAEKLPFRDAAFDMVVSTSTFQWLPDPERAFREAWRVLTPGGMFCFALFGERTLFELKRSYRSALAGLPGAGVDRTHNFVSASTVEAVMGRVGFRDIRVHAELEQEMHADVPTLLRSLKRIGAGNAAVAPSRGLAERRVMLDMMAAYRDEYGAGGVIPATYEVVYGMGRKQL